MNVKKEKKIVDFDENIPHKFDDVRIQDDSSPQKIFEIDESTKFFVFPLSDFEKLNVKCEEIVNDAQYDIEKQFIVGKRLLEGNGDFQQNVSVGLKYIKHSMSKNCLQSIIYYSRMLIKGNIIKKDLEKAKKIIHSISKTKDNQIFVLNGKIAKKEKNFKEARYHFLNGLKNKDDESIYKYAKMLFLGEGGKKNEKEAFKYFNELNRRGYSKSVIFINVYSKLCKVKGFKRLATESQYIFIKNNDLNKITVNPKQTELIYFNNSLKSSNILNCFSSFQEVLIELFYPSDNFQVIFDFISKIKLKKVPSLKIGIVFTDLAQNSIEKCNSDSFSSFRIDSVFQSIPLKTFANLSSLKTISIPFSVTEINAFAFSGCTSLTKIDIPTSVTKIGDNAFSGCTSLPRLDLPSSVVEIGQYAFSGCSSLTTITIASSLTDISNHSFENCTSLRKVHLPQSLIRIGDFAFKGCSMLSEISIPSSVQVIGENSFYETSIKEVIFPQSIKEIGHSSFRYLPLRRVVFDSSSCLSILEKNIFDSCQNLVEINIPSSVTKIGSYSFNMCYSLSNIIIPSSVTMIDDYAFCGCNSLREIAIPPSVTHIGSYVFSQCEKLEKVAINSSINKISFKLFFKCESLANINIPPSITEICPQAFLGCPYLEEIILPSSLKKIGSFAFAYCGLTEVKIPSSVEEIGSNAFKNCESLEIISIPASLIKFDEFDLPLNCKINKY